MDRRLSIGIGAGVIATAAALVVFQSRAKLPTSVPPAQPSTARASAATLDAASMLAAAVIDAAAPALPDFPPGTRLPDGSEVPRLPEKTAKSVRFGVVLVTYRGAQGAPGNARTKSEALEMAQKLASDAKTDFQGAVVRGDSGSVKDIGRVPRGVLEPAPEYVLFTMANGSVSEPIDTPRGFWIVKRTE